MRYVVIGATAFPVHGYARGTLDVDIFIEATDLDALIKTKEAAGRPRDLEDLKILRALNNTFAIRMS